MLQIPYSTSTGQQLATIQLTTSPGSIAGIDLMPPNAGYAILTVYDTNNSDTASLIVTQLYVDAGTVGINHEYFAPVAINRGIYCTLVETGGTGAQYFLRYNAG